MATAREEGGYGAGGKFKKRPFRRQTTPYDRPRTALRNPPNINVNNNNNGWLSKLVDPAQRLIVSSAHRLFASVFRKRLPPPPPPPLEAGYSFSSLETSFCLEADFFCGSYSLCLIVLSLFALIRSNCLF